MSKRLQVIMDDAEYHEIQEAAEARRLTVSAWVRQTLRQARGSAGQRGPTLRSTSGPDVRTLAEGGAGPRSPDPALIRRVMERHGLATAAKAIDFALRRTVGPPLTRSEMLSLRGTGWSEDLSALRPHPRRSGDPTGGPAS